MTSGGIADLDAALQKVRMMSFVNVIRVLG
jgi:hypothetical protein